MTNPSTSPSPDHHPSTHPSTRHPGTRAVVIGASIGGLLAARVLADHVAQVVIVERDEIGPEGRHRKGVQQAQHTHGLLASGQRAIEALLPGLTADLAARGAVLADCASDIAYANEGHALARAGASGLLGIGSGRLMLEEEIRRRVLALPGIELRTRCAALELCLGEPGRVTGLRVSHRDDDTIAIIDADLVVDASGRGSRAAAWLEAIGFGRPEVDEVVVGLSYTTREFLRPPRADEPGAFIAAGSRHNPRGGVLLNQPGGRCIVTLGGYLGDAAPTDLDGFRDFARSLDVTALADAIEGLTPVGEPRTFKYHASTWRRYDRMRRLPEGFVVFGDAVCSFNPIYGQGMTLAAREAVALQRCLRRNGLRHLPRRFHRAAAREIAIAWQVAAAADLKLPAVQGRRTLTTRLSNWYLPHFFRAAAGDPVLTARFVEVVNLLARPDALLRPGTVARVLRGVRRAPAPAPRRDPSPVGA